MITVRLTEEIWEEACRGNRLLFPEDGPEIAELLKAGERVTISLGVEDWVLDKDGSYLFRSGTYDRVFSDWLKKFYPEAFL